jgi:cytoskeletal protein RodZ
MKTQKSIDPNTLYREQLVDLGVVLQTARQRQGLSLDDMAGKTLIRASLLAAIEQGDLDSLPEPIYVRGLIRRYGDALLLDGEALSIQFFAPQPVSRPSWKDSPAAQLRPLHLYGAYVVLMVFAVSGLSYLLRLNAPEATTLPPLEPLETVENSDGESAPTAEPADPSPTTDLTDAIAEAAPEGESPIEVEMTLTSQSWLRVVSDGSTEFEGMLQPGDNRLWTAKEQLTIRAGNAGGVFVSFNDGQAQALGKPGMVTEVTYAPDKVLGLVQ